MLVVVTAVAAERDAVAAALTETAPLLVGPYDARAGSAPVGQVVVLAGGVGPAAAAAAAATAAAHLPVEALVSMGVAGAFPSARLAIGDVVLASTIVAADLGTRTAEAFLDLTALGFGDAVTTCDVARIATVRERLVAAGMHVAVGPVLTLSTATGTQERAEELMAEHGAIAEAMEGSGVAHVARLHGLPVLEVRTVSNQVGPRDVASWDLPGALRALRRAAVAVVAA